MSSKMKILSVNKFFFLKGGSERVLFQEREFLLEQGGEVTEFAMADSRNFLSPSSSFFVSHIDYERAGSLGKKICNAFKFVHSPEAVEKAEQLVLKEKPDIAHLHNIYHQLTPSIIPVLKRHGVRTVLTLHDGKLICPSYLMLNRGRICTACGGQYFWKPLATNCQGSRMREILLMSEAYWHKWKQSYDAVDLFISPSHFLAKLISQRIPKHKIRVLHNGIPADKFVPNYLDKGYALYFGRLSKEKGIETLLKAHKILSDSLTLKVVGTGPMEAELRQKYPAAEFLGYKQGNELNDIISKSAFVVVPSEWYENCSMVVLEAMSMGKAVIGSRIGGIPEQVENGKTGFLFTMGDRDELADKMRILSDDPLLRIELGKQARMKLEREYTLADHCKGLWDIYEKLMIKETSDSGR